MIATDTNFMKEAVRLALNGMGHVCPNPMVGAVIVKDGRIIGKGLHERYGGLHAERNAFANCTEDCTGADMYVTLEPCCHHGKQPPCTDAIIEHEIGHVYIGSSDPNPLVSGKGVQILREHGIEVTENVLKDECDSINEIFFHYITTGLPLVTMKYAQTLDGKIACYTGESKWITGAEARQRVHMDRKKFAAVMVGIGTVLKDDPMLNCRIENGRDPIRIVCDSHLRIPLDCNIVRTAKEIPTMIAAVSGDSEKSAQLEALGCKIVRTAPKNDRVDLKELVQKLGKMKIDSIILEGGSQLNWSALECGIVDKVQAYIAPKIFGGADSKSAVGGIGVPCPDKAFLIENTEIQKIGEDYLIEGRVKYVHRNS